MSDILLPIQVHLQQLLTEVLGDCKENPPSCALRPEDAVHAYVLLSRIKMMSDYTGDKFSRDELCHVLEVGFDSLAERCFSMAIKDKYGKTWDAGLGKILSQNIKLTRLEAMVRFYAETYINDHETIPVLDGAYDLVQHMQFWRENAMVPLLAMLYCMRSS